MHNLIIRNPNRDIALLPWGVRAGVSLDLEDSVLLIFHMTMIAYLVGEYHEINLEESNMANDILTS